MLRFCRYRLPYATLLCLVLSAALSSVPQLSAAHAEPPKEAATPRIRLTVRISDLRNSDGKLCLALFRGKEGFPNREDRAVAHTVVAIADGQAEAVFPDLPPGEYAVSLFHDENGNGKLDMSLGFPLEGFGVSNNPRPRFGPPRWKDACFTLSTES